MVVVHGNSDRFPAPDTGTDMEERDANTLLNAIGEHRDSAAFAELCERFQRQAFSMAFRVLRSRPLAEDAVQEAMLAVWLSAHSFDVKRGNARSWVLSIVMNKSVNLKQNQAQRAKREERIRMERGTLDEAAAEAEGRELIALLRQKIDELPELECMLLTCCYGAGMTHQKIAELAALPRRSVSKKIQEALDRLQADLSKAGFTAVLPLLGAENLFEAVTTGHECPPAMLDRIVRKTKNPALKSVRRAPVKSGSWIGVAAGFALAAAVGGGIWFATSPHPQTAPVAQQPQTVAPVATVATETPLHRTWTFESPDSGLKPAAGEWIWRRGDNTRPGAVVIPGEIAILLPPQIPHQPMKVSIKARWSLGENTKDDSGISVYWSDGERIPSETLWKTAFDSSSDRLHPVVDLTSDYLTVGRFGLHYHDGKYCGVSKFTREYPYDRLLVTIKNCTVEKIELRALRPDEIQGILPPDEIIAEIKKQADAVTLDLPEKVMIPKAP